jgi:hypothetical protein
MEQRASATVRNTRAGAAPFSRRLLTRIDPLGPLGSQQERRAFFEALRQDLEKAGAAKAEMIIGQGLDVISLQRQIEHSPLLDGMRRKHDYKHELDSARRLAKKINAQLAELDRLAVVRPSSFVPVFEPVYYEPHEYICPHDRVRKQCAKAGDLLRQLADLRAARQVDPGWQRLQHEKEQRLVNEIVALGVSAEASASECCAIDFYRGPLPPSKSGRPKSRVQAELIIALIGLERRSGLLTRAGLSENKAIAAVKEAMATCFETHVSQNAIAQHLYRLRQSGLD